MKVTLKDKKIPRNQAGDPQFTQLSNNDKTLDEFYKNTRDPQLLSNALLECFTPQEIVELVNRCLYQLEYQTRAHKLRAAREREGLAPIKTALKRLFPGVSFINATEEQLEAAALAVKEEK